MKRPYGDREQHRIQCFKKFHIFAEFVEVERAGEEIGILGGNF